MAACAGGSERRPGAAGSVATTSLPGAGGEQTVKATRGGEFCTRIAGSFNEAFGLGAVNASSSDAMRQEFERARVHSDQTVAVAPDAIRADLLVLTTAVAGVRDALAGVGYDIAALGPGAASAFRTPEVQQATARTLAYVKEHCGIDLGSAG